MKKILLPTDFSDNAWSAAVYAIKFYAEKPCEFYFLHASNSKVSTISNISNKLTQTLNEIALNDLKELKEMAEGINTKTDHTFHILLSTDSLKDAIKTNAKKYEISLVVMGTKGATKAKGIFFGSNTVQIIKKIKDCPILVVPDEFNFAPPKQIAFPTDFDQFYGDELLQLKQLAQVHNSKIRIVHINERDSLTDTQNYNLSMLNVNLQDQAHSFHWMPDYAKKVKEINDFIEDLDINILAMIHYKQSFIESIINEPVIEKIGFSPLVPFFVIPALD